MIGARRSDPPLTPPELDLSDPQSVRRFRLHLRDLRTILEALHALRPSSRRTPIPRRLRRMWRATSRIRDADVQRELLAEVAEGLPERVQDTIRKARKELRRERRRQVRRFERNLGRLAPRELVIPSAAVETLDHYWHHVWSEVLEDRAPLLAGEPADRVHRSRRTLKRIRAILRVALARHIPINEELLEGLQTLNRRLGTARDHRLLQERLESMLPMVRRKGDQQELRERIDAVRRRGESAAAEASALFRALEPVLAVFTLPPSVEWMRP